MPILCYFTLFTTISVTLLCKVSNFSSSLKILNNITILFKIINNQRILLHIHAPAANAPATDPSENE